MSFQKKIHRNVSKWPFRFLKFFDPSRPSQQIAAKIFSKVLLWYDRSSKNSSQRTFQQPHWFRWIRNSSLRNFDVLYWRSFSRISSKRTFADVEVKKNLSEKSSYCLLYQHHWNYWSHFGFQMFSIQLCGVCLTTSSLQDWWLAVNDAEGLEERVLPDAWMHETVGFEQVNITRKSLKDVQCEDEHLVVRV